MMPNARHVRPLGTSQNPSVACFRNGRPRRAPPVRGPTQERQQGALFDPFAEPLTKDRYLRIPPCAATCLDSETLSIEAASRHVAMPRNR